MERELLAAKTLKCWRQLSEPKKPYHSELEFSASFAMCWEGRKTMMASKLSDAQKVFIVKQGPDGMPVARSDPWAGLRTQARKLKQ